MKAHYEGLRVLLVAVVLAEGTMGGTTTRDHFTRGVGAPSAKAHYEVLRLLLVTVVIYFEAPGKGLGKLWSSLLGGKTKMKAQTLEQ